MWFILFSSSVFFILLVFSLKTGISDSQLSALSSGLKVFSSITELNLNELFIIINALNTVIMKGDFGDSGIHSLAETLKVNSFLTSLSLELIFLLSFIYSFLNQNGISCNVGDSGLCLLSEGLKVNSSLTSLHLEG